MATLIDTCIMRELQLPRPFWRVRRAIDDLWWEDVRVSVISFAILQGGMLHLEQEFKQRRVRGWMQTLSRKLGGSLLTVDYETSLAWGKIANSAERRRLKLPFHDGLMAAIAKRHGLTVMTRNVGYFTPFNIEVFNPWASERDNSYDFGEEPAQFSIRPGSTSADLSVPRHAASEDDAEASETDMDAENNMSAGNMDADAEMSMDMAQAMPGSPDAETEAAA